MSRIAVLYDTTEGQTAKIAGKVAEVIKGLGHEVVLVAVRALPENFELDRFEGVILGGSIHVGKHSATVVEFVKRNHHSLQAVPSAFFSVSLSAAGKTDRQQQNAHRCLDAFLAETGWNPQMTATIAGALRYREYGFFKRMALKWIAKQEGGDTDTSKNYEYTDWQQVDDFTREFVRRFAAES